MILELRCRSSLPRLFETRRSCHHWRLKTLKQGCKEPKTLLASEHSAASANAGMLRGRLKEGSYIDVEKLDALKQAVECLRSSDLATYGALLTECAKTKALLEGKWVHLYVIRSGLEKNIFLGNLIIGMYGNCGSLLEANMVFEKMLNRNRFSWTAVVAAYVQEGKNREALKLFKHMQLGGLRADKVAYLTILKACSGSRGLSDGRLVHAGILLCILQYDIVLETALLNMYGKCESLKDARVVFDRMHKRDLILWTAMISSYAQHGCGNEALKLFVEMEREGKRPNKVTFVSILDACADSASFSEGKTFHDCAIRCGLESDVYVATALVNMYSKCGDVKDAQMAFAKICHPNVVSWNSIVAAYAHHGHVAQAMQLFQQMQSEGMKPDRITFVSILSVCGYAGKLKEGHHYFASISADYGVKTSEEHCRCVIDLLGRAGQLHEAEDLINNVPFLIDVKAWISLLGRCKIDNKMEKGIYNLNYAF